MNSIDTFLDLYRELENALKAAYSGKKVTHSSLILEYMNNEGSRYFEQLDLCRELRNVFSHHPSFEGLDVMIPTDRLINFMKKVIFEVNNPPVALDIGTPKENILHYHLADKAGEMLSAMFNRGFSHIPITDNGVIIGIFSIESAFLYQRETGKLIDENTLIYELKEYLSLENRFTETYRFTDKNSHAAEIKTLFEPRGPKRRRVAAVFVTSNGKPDGKLLAMITPWDLLKDSNDPEF